METLETQRLILRSWQENDLEDFYEYGKNPEIGPNAGWKPHSNIEESRKILNSFVKTDENWAVVFKENKKAIGSLGISKDKIGHEGMGSGKEIGYVLSQDYWGKGLMTEAVKRVLEFAFKKLNLDFVSVSHFPFNARSKRVIEKCGFKYEKTLKNSCTNYNGEKLDEMCYILTKAEYLEQIGEKA